MYKRLNSLFILLIVPVFISYCQPNKSFSMLVTEINKTGSDPELMEINNDSIIITYPKVDNEIIKRRLDFHIIKDLEKNYCYDSGKVFITYTNFHHTDNMISIVKMLETQGCNQSIDSFNLKVINYLAVEDNLMSFHFKDDFIKSLMEKLPQDEECNFSSDNSLIDFYIEKSIPYAMISQSKSCHFVSKFNLKEGRIMFSAIDTEIHNNLNQ